MSRSAPLFTKPKIGRLSPTRERVAMLGAGTHKGLRDAARAVLRERQWREVLKDPKR